jgi:hypothetical protein
MKITDNQLTRAIYSSWDFQQALSALTFLLEDCEYDKKYSRIQLRRFRCYEATCIVSLARPFQQSRNAGTLSLKAVGINLNKEERCLLDKILYLRRKVIAHSDEEEMHFLAASFLVTDTDLRFPHLQFSESLELTEVEAQKIERLLHKLMNGIAKVTFEVAQSEPTRLERYKIPARASEWLQDGTEQIAASDRRPLHDSAAIER